MHDVSTDLKAYPFLKLPNSLRGTLMCIGIGLFGFIAYSSLVPTTEPPNIQNIDKVMHFLGYGALGACLLPGLARVRPILVVTLTIALGTGVEIAQGLLPTGRTASAADALANSLGALGAWAVWLVLMRIWTARLTRRGGTLT